MKWFRAAQWLLQDLGILTLPILLFFALLIADCNFDSRAQVRCLAAGYPVVHTTWTFDTYCSRRINNTDEVIKLP